jgi:y4mF family transcriptional regulator
MFLNGSMGDDMTDDKSVANKISEATSKPFSEALQDAMRNSNTLQGAMGSFSSSLDALANDAPAALAQSALKKIPSSSETKIHSVSDIGVAVRNARKSKNLTQQEFADLAGVGRRFLSELESGKPTLEIGKVLKVAAAAGIQLMLVSKADE